MGKKGEEQLNQTAADRDAGLFAELAQAAAERTPGLVPDAVENSLAGVMSLAETLNPNLATAFRSALESVVEYNQAAMVPEAQVINPLDTRLGGV